MFFGGPLAVPSRFTSVRLDEATGTEGGTVTEETWLDEIVSEHDVDAVLGLMTADGTEAASLLDEAAPIGPDPDEDEDAH